MAFPANIKLVLLHLLQQAVRRNRERRENNERESLAVAVSYLHLYRTFCHALRRGRFPKGVPFSGCAQGQRQGTKRLSRRIVCAHKQPEGVTLPQSTPSRKRNCREQCKTPLTVLTTTPPASRRSRPIMSHNSATVKRTNRPQSRSRAGFRPRKRASVSASEASSHTQKPDYHSGLLQLDSTEPAAKAFLFGSLQQPHQPPHLQTMQAPLAHQQQQQQQLPQQQPLSFLLQGERQQKIDGFVPEQLVNHDETLRTQQQQDVRMMEKRAERDSATFLKAAASTADGSGRQSSLSNPLPRYKRPAHIDAEYRRRSKIQRGFDLVRSLVPELRETSSANSKQSKAAMLTKSADYIRQMVADFERKKTEMEKLQEEISSLQTDLQLYQEQLPSSGVNAVERPSCHTGRWLDHYLHTSIADDWRFWIFSFLVRPLYETFSRSVTLTSEADFLQSVERWSDSRLTLINLRPLVLSLLRNVSMTTSIIREPEKLQEEVLAMMDCDIKPVKDCYSLTTDIRTDSRFNVP